ncbi:Hypothetical predicted protein, partial [Xyrichtys novacula]
RGALLGHIATIYSTTAAAQAKSSNHYLPATRSHKHASRNRLQDLRMRPTRSAHVNQVHSERA